MDTLCQWMGSRLTRKRWSSLINLDEIRDDYQKALRAWHLTWAQRELAHRDHFPPENLEDPGLVYESVIEELRQAKEVEERAYDHFLRARDVLSKAMRSP